MSQSVGNERVSTLRSITAIVAVVPLSRFGRDGQDDELGGLEWRKANHDIHQPCIDIILRGRSGIAFNEVSVTWRPALEGSLRKIVCAEKARRSAESAPREVRRSARKQPIGFRY